jgi:hypothetical protein
MTQRAEVLNSENDRLNSTVSMLYGDVADKSAKISAYEQELLHIKNEIRLPYSENALFTQKPREAVPQYAASEEPEIPARHYEEPLRQHYEEPKAAAMTPVFEEKHELNEEPPKKNEYNFVFSAEEPREQEQTPKTEEKENPEQEREQPKPLSDATNDALIRFKAFLEPERNNKRENEEKTKGDWRDFFFR